MGNACRRGAPVWGWRGFHAPSGPVTRADRDGTPGSGESRSIRQPRPLNDKARARRSTTARGRALVSRSTINGATIAAVGTDLRPGGQAVGAGGTRSRWPGSAEDPALHVGRIAIPSREATRSRSGRANAPRREREGQQGSWGLQADLSRKAPCRGRGVESASLGESPRSTHCRATL